MRPTVPLSAWRIAIDLNATRMIRRQTGHPAENCACADCITWRSVAPSAFPATLDGELRRLGIESGKPTDLYVFGRNERTLEFRVMFHIVGRIVSGPAPWVDGIDQDRMYNYHVVQSKPTWISLRVCVARESFQYAPTLDEATRSHILCVDLRLQVRAVAAQPTVQSDRRKDGASG